MIPMVAVPQVRGASIGTATGTSLTVNTPAGARTGDILLLYLGHDSGNQGIPFTATGWTKVAENANANVDVGVFWRLLRDTPPTSYSFTASAGTADFKGMIVAINPKGRRLRRVRDAWTLGDASVTQVTPLVGGAVPPSIFVAFFFNDSLFSVTEWPRNMVSLGSDNSSSSCIAGAYRVNPLGGQIAAMTFSSGDQTARNAVMVEFAP